MSDKGNKGGKGRGRARGRAREMPPEQPEPGQRAVGGWAALPPRPVPVAQPQPQAGPSQAQQASTSSASSRPLSQESGDLSGAMQAMQLGPSTSGGGGEQLGRGAMRGRRQLPEITLCTRPKSLPTKQGITGKPVKLRSNHFPLLQRSTTRLYHYHVDFAPEEDETYTRKALLRIHNEKLGGHIFDGMSLFTIHPLRTQPIELFSKRHSDEQTIRITVRLVADVADGDAHYIQVYNTILREAMRYLGLKLVGRDLCDPEAKIVISQYHLELWPKYFTSIRQHESQIMMCCDISTKKMSTKTVYDILVDTCRENPERYRDAFTKKVLGTVVLTTYSNKTYRVDDIDFKRTPKSTFSRKGENITYIRYYKERHGIVILNPDQPLLETRRSARERRAGESETLRLVPELCKTTGLSEDMRNNFQLMRAVADQERLDPTSRVQRLEQFNQRLQSNDDIKRLFAKEWEMEIAPKLVEFEGRVLPDELIVAGGNCTYTAGAADWTKYLRSNPMLSNVHLHNWVVITPARCKNDTESFVEALKRAGLGMTFQLASPKFQVIPDDRILTYKEALDRVRQLYNPQLVMCVVPSNNGDRYAMIKKETCCSNFVVPSQVILARSLNRPSIMSIATKVVIQMNCKIGGAPWTVNIPLKGLMVCGFDVCHNSMNKGMSYGALVCSLDQPMTRYFSVVSEHSNGEELSSFLALHMTMALKKYQEYNNALPLRIVFYRDGVGDGQLHYVVSVEVESLKSRLREMYQGDTYKLAFIIVTKRINVRIFADRGNPDPGTIVDDCITLPEKYDFYLVSQSVRQGTVSPTSYNVIFDNINLSADQLQRLTYKMTHLYFNWSGTVRVPAPTQYAHKLAYLVGKFTHRMPSRELEDTLYFL